SAPLHPGRVLARRDLGDRFVEGLVHLRLGLLADGLRRDAYRRLARRGRVVPGQQRPHPRTGGRGVTRRPAQRRHRLLRAVDADHHEFLPAAFAVHRPPPSLALWNSHRHRTRLAGLRTGPMVPWAPGVTPGGLWMIIGDLCPWLDHVPTLRLEVKVRVQSTGVSLGPREEVSMSTMTTPRGAPVPHAEMSP